MIVTHAPWRYSRGVALYVQGASPKSVAAVSWQSFYPRPSPRKGKIMDKCAPQEIDQLVGRRIREGRQQRGISQMALADKLNLSFQQIQKYEKAKYRVSAGRLSEIAYIFEVPEQWFFGASEFSLPPNIQPDIHKLISVCKQLDHQTIKLLISMACNLKRHQ